jgi:hypothetical protein
MYEPSSPRGLSVGSTSRSLSDLNGVLGIAALTQVVWVPVFLVDALPQIAASLPLPPAQGTKPVTKLATTVPAPAPVSIPYRDPLLAPFPLSSGDPQISLLPPRAPLSTSTTPMSRTSHDDEPATPPRVASATDAPPPRLNGVGDSVYRVAPHLLETPSEVHRPYPATPVAMTPPPRRSRSIPPPPPPLTAQELDESIPSAI